MNKTVLILVALILIGGGAYYMMSQNAAAPAADTAITDEGADHQMSDTQMPSGATMEDGTIPEASGAATSSTSADASPAASTGSVKEFTVDGDNYKFAPASLTVKKGDTVKITFKNTGGFHDFVIDEFNVRTKQIQGGASETVTFVADKAGQFEYYCSVGKHRQMGMKGTLTVQ